MPLRNLRPAGAGMSENSTAIQRLLACTRHQPTWPRQQPIQLRRPRPSWQLRPCPMDHASAILSIPVRIVAAPATKVVAVAIKAVAIKAAASKEEAATTREEAHVSRYARALDALHTPLPLLTRGLSIDLPFPFHRWRRRRRRRR